MKEGKFDIPGDEIEFTIDPKLDEQLDKVAKKDDKILNEKIVKQQEVLDETLKRLDKCTKTKYESAITINSRINLVILAFNKYIEETDTLPIKYKDILKKIDEAKNSIASSYAPFGDGYHTFVQHPLLKDKIPEISEEGQEDLKGEGLELINEGEVKKIDLHTDGATDNTGKLYFNGKFIADVEHAAFDKKSINDKIVTWKTSENMDYNERDGYQKKFRIYVWKKGFKEPKELFEDHSWEDERFIHVSIPEVSKDGTITFKVNGEKKVVNI